uniref:Nad5 n=1 Tax=Neorotalia gaimardi TaxID=2855197 RepID=UPI0023F40E29|nr:Nad5 [Neorotalia gaimardi]WEF49974.1 Nad5 [Neorotalia gaimardi]
MSLLFICLSLFTHISLIILWIKKYRIDWVLLLTIMKCYILYWIISINFSISYILINLYSHINLYITILMNHKFYPLSWFMSTIVILISSIVIFNSISYLSIIDSYSFVFYITLFQLSMISFVLSHDIIITSLYWDLLGLISYLPINFWSSKINCGIKAVLYNKIGDNFSLFFISILYSLLSLTCYYPELSYSISLSFILTQLVIFNSFFTTFNIVTLQLLPLSLFSIIYSKSAQLPFSTWSLNATSAPTPISALSHSSTMVIAGVFLTIIIDDLLIIITDYFSLTYLLFYIIPLNTLLWSLFKAILLSDIKSIIALSTISQISYMFIALLINPILCFYHIIIHSLFKSILFLFAGSLIHIQYNYQNIYQVKMKCKFYWIVYLLTSNILILSISKEIIIHDIYLFLNSPFYFIILYLGAILTILYTFKIYTYCFWF